MHFRLLLISLPLLLTPLLATAQEEEPQPTNDVVVEESEPAAINQAAETLEGHLTDEAMPEAADFGLETAHEAVSQGGVDGQAVSESASDGRSESGAGSAGGGASGNGGAGGAGGGAGGGGAGGRN
ncbi:hypothetical protein ACFQH5_14225 [Halomonas salifodinae]|uniref:Uncharacterized protein n=1 Tax=Halomonas salifodinae TaxID=438745 RepID=A0ABW2F125_9GAMM